MEQKLVQRCETEIVADPCNASYPKPAILPPSPPCGSGPLTGRVCIFILEDYTQCGGYPLYRVGRGDFNKIFEKLSDQFALFSIFIIYQYESHKLFYEIFLGR